MWGKCVRSIWMHPKIRDEAQTHIMNACIIDLNEDIIVKTSNCQKGKARRICLLRALMVAYDFPQVAQTNQQDTQETIVTVCNSSTILCHLCWLGDLPCLVILGGKCSYHLFNHTTGSLSHFTIYTHLKFNRNPENSCFTSLGPQQPMEKWRFYSPTIWVSYNYNP